jgi:hypothetical protein
MPVGVPILVCFELVFCYFFIIENEEYVYSYLLSLLYPVHSARMLTSSGDICKSTHNLFLVVMKAWSRSITKLPHMQASRAHMWKDRREIDKVRDSESRSR